MLSIQIGSSMEGVEIWPCDIFSQLLNTNSGINDSKGVIIIIACGFCYYLGLYDWIYTKKGLQNMLNFNRALVDDKQSTCGLSELEAVGTWSTLVLMAK